MIAVLGDLVRNLVVIVFVNALLEMLLPQGQFHRYIRLVTGLIVILMVVNAFSLLLGRAPEVALAVPAVAAPAPGAGEASARLRLQERRLVLAVYRENLARLARDAIEAEGWRFVEAVFSLEEDPARQNFGALYRVDVRVEAPESPHQAASPVAPVLIGPVVPGGGEGESNAAGGATAERVPALEQVLAGRLGIPAGLVSVIRLN
jgi:stage III sporulation protein AF